LNVAAGDVVIMPGLNVWYPEHNRNLGEYVRAQGGRLVVVVHDFGPVTAAQYFPASYRAAYRGWMESLFPFADLFVADSENTRREMNVIAPELRRADCIVNPLAHEFPNELPNGAANVVAAIKPKVTQLEDYVLHVGRIEPRKNVVGLIKVWARLAGELWVRASAPGSGRSLQRSIEGVRHYPQCHRRQRGPHPLPRGPFRSGTRAALCRLPLCRLPLLL
jgi:glycosyltransferase involved in cell wall biosynthesis